MKRSVIIDGSVIEYELTYKKVKNLNLRIRRDGTVAVSAPIGFPFKRIDRFISDKSDFIISAHQRLLQKSKNTEACGFCDGDTVWVLGEAYRIKIEISKPSRILLTDNKIAVACVPDSSVENVKKAVLKLYERISEEYIYGICVRVHERLGGKACDMPEIKFRAAVGRWGSCYSGCNKIILNKFLAAVPSECIEYVVYHEFVHFAHPNHSAAFYRELEVHCPRHKELKKRLSAYSTVPEIMKKQ